MGRPRLAWPAMNLGKALDGAARASLAPVPKPEPATPAAKAKAKPKKKKR